MFEVTAMREVRKTLLSKQGYIQLGSHSKKQMNKRGYTSKDIVRSLLTGNVTGIERGHNIKLNRICPTLTVEGKDMDDNPIVVILSQEKVNGYLVVTVMPPINKARFKAVI
ncbi:DUF4258 domain-containing protein [Fictibacillus sp. KIGAM418]|uniref:DUF4258 domain-containing protein n=1 Tax=Fictibacillus marinisediminis TaxID=2878389 RepID=A0A9X1XH39_9BACL|nr:DUF4258 domain-containing protein [Fictibacillus marinisediminis]MCK6259533.1 DUF4258 domain-containing protein [Fictibacillus marinisediminis]